MILEKYETVKEHIKNPAKLAIAIGKDSNGRFNGITLEWVMKTSIEPPMFAISIGHTRYSHSCFQDFRYFNLCFPSPELLEFTKLCGSASGKDIDKFTESEIEYFPGKLVKLPVIRKAAANFECQIVTQVKSGDHTIFVGEVKYSWYDNTKIPMTYKHFI